MVAVETSRPKAQLHFWESWVAHENLVGLGNPAKLSVILWGGLLLFPTCCPAFQSNSIDDMGDGGLAAAHMACNVFSLLSSSMKKRE